MTIPSGTNLSTISVNVESTATPDYAAASTGSATAVVYEIYIQ